MFSQQKIETIVNRTDLVVRNLQITQGYYRLSRAMRKFMSNSNVSWLGFATHASKTAGQALRHELMPQRLKSAMIRIAGFDNTYLFLNDALQEEPEHQAQELTSAQSSLLAEALMRVSKLVSQGNVMVFDELAWPFSMLVKNFSRDWEYNEVKMRDFLQEHFRKGPIEKNGQDYLIEAFTAYYHARLESDSKRKAEYIFQGNMLIGFHEQTRLQPQIEEALTVPFDVFLGRGDADSAGKKYWKKKFGFSRKLITRTFTQMWMQFTLPNRALRIGRDIVAPTGAHSFPSDLVSIDDARCQALVHQFDLSPETLSGSAADNWGSLTQRMNFVVDFFRSYQQYKPLFEQPFTDKQIAAIEAGHMPAGPL